MRRLIPLLVGCGFIVSLAASTADAQKAKDKGKYDPPGNLEPTPAVLKQIADKTAQLAAKIAELRKNEKHHQLLPDVEIYLRGAQNIVRFKEFYNKASGQWTLDALDTGMQRADQLAKGETPWTTLEKRNVLRAYRSPVDDTAQPYGVTFPLEYGKDPKKNWRVDVVLHGRNATLTEVAFLNTHNGKKKPSADQDWVQIDIFGRGNNAYRWSGEWDVILAKNAFFFGESREKRHELVHPERVVLRGFSMGGAGTWHLGLRHPTHWTVMGPGAGFTTTHDYAWKGKKDLPDYQEKCLRIYDAIDYAENARMIPIVAYSGGDDPQKLAADNIENRLRDLKINSMTHLVNPGVGHTFTPDYFKKANELWSKHAAKPRNEFPKKLSFVTYSTKNPMCDWITIFAMEKQYEKATVDGELTETGCRLKTKNVSWLNVRLDDIQFADIEIDGQKLKGVEGENNHRRLVNADVEPSKWKWKWDFSCLLAMEDGRWQVRKIDDLMKKVKASAQKAPFLQGPIDDAFTKPFVCVIGSGETYHASTQKFVDAKLAAFKYDWGKHWRGELPTTGDYAVTPNDIMDKSLILFGDPQSNLTLAQMMPKLPLKWTKDEIEFAGKKYKTSEHVPVMIFPNPLNPMHYVVLNTGHTIPSEDYTKTNALLYPRLGDYAILRMDDGSVMTAGLFDESWKVEKK